MANTLTTRTIPQLFNGVSRQPAILRSVDQTESELNSWAAVSAGVGKRPPTETVAKLSNSVSGSAFVHLINRDASERYVVVIDGEDVKVVGFDGVARTVNSPGGTGYLNGASELIPNGTTNGWDVVVAGGDLSIDQGSFSLTAGASGCAYSRQITTVAGKQYRLRFDQINGTATGEVHIGTAAGGTTLGDNTGTNGNGQTLTFTATGTSTYVTLYNYGTTGQKVRYNLSLQELGVPGDVTAVTVADYTFIVNRDKTVLMKGVGADTAALSDYVRDPTRSPTYDETAGVPTLPGRTGGYDPNISYS